jgi:hypothetical protein
MQVRYIYTGEFRSDSIEMGERGWEGWQDTCPMQCLCLIYASYRAGFHVSPLPPPVTVLVCYILQQPFAGDAQRLRQLVECIVIGMPALFNPTDGLPGHPCARR